MIFKNRWRASIAVGVVSTAFAVLPGGAGAAFDVAHDTTCEVSGAVTVDGIGSTFQAGAQRAWGAAVPLAGTASASGFGYLDLFHASTNPTGFGCGAAAVAGGTTRVRYEPFGDDAARDAFGGQAGVRDTDFALGGVSEPPTAAEIAAANEGPTTGSGDNARLHTVPVAQSSVAVVVKLPANCTVAASSAQRRISRTALAAAFAGTATTWSAVLPGTTLTGTGCSTPVTRVVPAGGSGTTFVFKRYLRDIDPTTFPASQGNPVWPNDAGGTTAVRAAVPLDALNFRTDGGIAYADLATARDKGFDWRTGVTANGDTTFWLYVERSTGAYATPAASNNAGATGANRGSNCATTEYANAGGAALPSTTQSWYDVTANETTGGYSLCALTYALAWERPSLANVGSLRPPITQDQARTVRDYLGFVIEDKNGLNGTPRAGQSQLAAAGYQKLPEDVRTEARTGVSLLNW